MPDLTGSSIGRYTVLEQLGKGGMATVYKAYDTRLERDVALKIIRKEAFSAEVVDRILQRFEREAKALSRLAHANIVPIIDYGDEDGVPYLVMPYIAGGTLKQSLTGKPMPLEDILRWIAPITRALGYAHGRGILHRDVKPSNILLTESGDPLLADFGVAKLLEGEEGNTLTGTGVGMGTPEYMSPEQWVGQASPASDQYSLGVVLFEMVTGVKPYTAETPAAILLKQANDPLPRPGLLVPGLPDALEKVLLKALAKKPEDRFTDMAAFEQALLKLGQTQSNTAASAAAHAAPENEATLDDLVTREEQPPVVPPAPTPAPAWQPTTYSGRPPGRKNAWLAWAALGLLGLASVIVGIALGTGGRQSALPVPTNTTQAVNTQTAQPSKTATRTSIPATNTPSLGIGSTMTTAGGMVMIYIPGGTFQMGSNDGSSDEEPVHSVTLSPYWIDRTEVTNGMYARCVRAGKCSPPDDYGSYTRFSYYGNSTYYDYPVIYVSWHDAKAYCEWAGKQLPTEAQWEFAARGENEHTYPWGDTSPSCSKANYSGCAGDTVEVGSYQSGKSPFGVYHMAGNVWEWVYDWYGNYSSSSQTDPTGPSSGDYRVLRGGSWLVDENLIRSSLRLRYSPDRSYINYGFRCSLTP